jgi:Mn-dependent DtxR family transcriptional regulator
MIEKEIEALLKKMIEVGYAEELEGKCMLTPKGKIELNKLKDKNKNVKKLFSLISALNWSFAEDFF